MRLFVRFNGTQIPLAQIAHDRIYFAQPVSIPAGLAEVVVEINGHAKLTPVLIRSGQSPTKIAEYSAA